MTREFLEIVEEATQVALVPSIGMSATEVYLRSRFPKLALELFGKIAEAAPTGAKWSSIIASAPTSSWTEIEGMNLTMINVASAMQEHGFQTDEVHAEVDGVTYHQLTVFWANGKDIYEHELHRLGAIDPELLAATPAVAS